MPFLYSYHPLGKKLQLAMEGRSDIDVDNGARREGLASASDFARPHRATAAVKGRPPIAIQGPGLEPGPRMWMALCAEASA